VRGYERLPETPADLHVIALVCIMLRQVAYYIAVHHTLLISGTLRWPGSIQVSWVAPTSRTSSTSLHNTHLEPLSKKTRAAKLTGRPADRERQGSNGIMSESMRATLFYGQEGFGSTCAIDHHSLANSSRVIRRVRGPEKTTRDFLAVSGEQQRCHRVVMRRAILLQSPCCVNLSIA
jgi:hypothetical protein